jgi:hypothetical protein
MWIPIVSHTSSTRRLAALFFARELRPCRQPRQRANSLRGCSETARPNRGLAVFTGSRRNQGCVGPREVLSKARYGSSEESSRADGSHRFGEVGEDRRCNKGLRASGHAARCVATSRLSANGFSENRCGASGSHLVSRSWRRERVRARWCRAVRQVFSESDSGGAADIGTSLIRPPPPKCRPLASGRGSALRVAGRPAPRARRTACSCKKQVALELPV